MDNADLRKRGVLLTVAGAMLVVLLAGCTVHLLAVHYHANDQQATNAQPSSLVELLGAESSEQTGDQNGNTAHENAAADPR